MAKTITLHSVTVKTPFGLHEFDLSEAPDEFILGMLQHAYKQKIGDRYNSGGKDTPLADRAKQGQEVVDSLRAFQLSKRLSGAERLDLFETCLREKVSDAFVSAGVKRTQADKDARDAKHREALYRDIVIKPRVASVAPEKIGDLPNIAARNWDKLVTAAQEQAERLAAAREATKVEIDF